VLRGHGRQRNRDPIHRRAGSAERHRCRREMSRRNRRDVRDETECTGGHPGFAGAEISRYAAAPGKFSSQATGLGMA